MRMYLALGPLAWLFMSMASHAGIEPGAPSAQLRLEFQSQFGGVDGPEALTTIGSAIRLPGGEVVVTQPRDAGVVFFGANGNVRARVERRGEGPGDFAQPYWIQRNADNVLITDAHLNRVTAFTSSAELDTVIQLPPTHTVRGLRAVVRGMSGRRLVVVAGDPVPRLSRDASPGILGAVDGRSLDTQIWADVRMAGEVGELRNPRQPDGMTYFRYQFPTSDIVALSPSGLGAVRIRRFPVESGAADVIRYEADGTVAYRVSLASPVVQIPPREFELARERLVRGAMRALFTDRRAAYAAADQVIANVRVYPPALDGVVADDGRLWVLQPSEMHEDGAWTVLDSAGSVVARGVRHPGGRLLYASATHALFEYVDDEGIPFIKVYQVRRA